MFNWREFFYHPVISGGNVIEQSRPRITSQIIGFVGPGVASVMAALTDDGAEAIVITGFLPINQPSRITATAGGTTADIKAIQCIVVGTDENDLSITETLPAFTVNTAGTVTGAKVFKTVTQVTIPAHDGTGATTSLGLDGSPGVADADGVMLALTDDGAEAIVLAGTDINTIDAPRNITATSGGTSTDIKAIQVTIDGEDMEGNVIQEVLPIFTVNSATTVTGAKIFAKVTQITIPAHDGTGATTAIGTGSKLGIDKRLSRNSVYATYLNDVIEGTAATVTVDATNLESNGATPNTTLNATPVRLDYVEV